MSMGSLLTARRFLPVFIVQFLGALNDNLFRNAIFVLVTFQLAARQGINAPVIVSLGAGLFILPFFLFSATAGALADRLEKSRLIRILKGVEFALFCLAGATLLMENVTLMLVTLFLLGMQASFFGPVKYSILPQLVNEGELVAANGYVEGGTFLAILLGTIAGGIVITLPQGAAIIAATMAALSLAGWVVSCFIPKGQASNPGLKFNWRFLSATWPLLKDARKNRPVWRSILGISWFWFVGAVFLSVLPNYVKDVLNGDATLVTFLLTLFSVGIAAGSILCNRLLRGAADARFVPLAALGMGVATFAVYGFSAGFTRGTEALTISYFLSQMQGIEIAVALVLLALCGGIFTVPLYTMMQTRSDAANRARIIAANNIVNSLFMVASSVFTLVMFKCGYGVTGIFLALAVVTCIVALYICSLLPQATAKGLFRFVLRLAYRVKVKGLDHFDEVKGQGAVFVVNHTSLIDGMLIAAFLPDFPTFAVNTTIARNWWVKMFLHLVDHHTIDPTKPMALKSLVDIVATGRHVVIFPEGRITMTGSLMKVYEGPGVIASNARAPLVAVRIDGAQYTPFSYLKGKVHQRWFPKIEISILPPVTIETDAGLTSRQRRKAIADRLYDIMGDMMFSTCAIDRTLYETLLSARKLNGGSTKIIEDLDRAPVSYDRLITLSRALGGRFARATRQSEIVGLLLPNSVATAGAFFGLLAYGRIPAMLNFTSGLSNIQDACKAAEIEHIITSRRFIQMAEMQPLIDGLSGMVAVIYLEDVAAGIGMFGKMQSAFSAHFAASLYRKLKVKPDDTAVVLFTSGSEGTPKGVALSHRNILANRYQLGVRIDFNASDTVFNALPVFHSFGLTAGLLLPLLAGVRVFLYPSPLHYRIVSELVYDTNATILFGTDTFLSGYARMAHPYDFYSVRYVFAGAERVKNETRRAWNEKFGVRVLEGYGATETAPTLAINTPMHAKAGTVGRLLPGIDCRLEPVTGIAEGGKFVVRGPNIMRGYYKNDQPGVLQAPKDGWYDTGDIVTVDAQGFITIVGRVKRFAKIAGEMVSLGAVESYIQALYPDHQIAVVAVADDKKGEQLALFSTGITVMREALVNQARALSLTELMVPRQIFTVDALPVLGTGKTDYATLGQMALAKTGTP